MLEKRNPLSDRLAHSWTDHFPDSHLTMFAYIPSIRRLCAGAISLAVLPVQSQEVDCNNGFDDDDDIVTDCADINCATGCEDAFPCASASHLFQVVEGRDLREWVGGQWQDVDGYTPPVNPDDAVNAMGYNVQDGFIYGIRYPNHLIRVTRTGMFDLGEVTGLPTLAPYQGVAQGYHTGDFNLDGELYVSNRYQTNMWVVDVSAVAVVAVVPLTQNSGGTSVTLDMIDFAYMPSVDLFVGMRRSDTNKLRRIEPTGNVLASVTFPAGHPVNSACSTGYGATFADVNGRLYAYCNAGGTSFFKITPVGTTWDDNSLLPSELDAVSLGTGLVNMINNDGAACPLGCGLDDECCPGLDLVRLLKPMHGPSEKETERMQHRISELESELATYKKSAAVLMQNQPNPFSENCSIHYGFEDLGVRSASIAIFSLNGSLVHSYPVEVVEEGLLVIEGRSFEPGTYLYTLIADGREVDTKRMILLSE